MIAEYDIRAGMRIAILGAITPNVRRVLVVQAPHTLRIIYRYDVLDQSDIEEDFPNLVETEMDNFFGKYAQIEYGIEVLGKSPQSDAGIIIYQRYEPLKMGLPIFAGSILNFVAWRSAFQIALLGCITKHLRYVFSLCEDGITTLRFVYQVITDREERLSTMVVDRLKAWIPNERFAIQLIELPFPSVPPKEGLAEYARCEYFP